MGTTYTPHVNGYANTPYPLRLKQSFGPVDNIPTNVAVYSFTDKIMITVSQEGMLAQWIQVSLDPSHPSRGHNTLPSDPDDMLPSADLDVRTLLGGGTPDREAMGKLYASQLATMIAAKHPEEARPVLVGLGLRGAEAGQEQFLDLMELVVKCL